MHNLLEDALISVSLANGSTDRLSLPEVYAAMAADRVTAFPALRSHQRHAWHAFLAQLGAISLHRAGRVAPPVAASEWRQLLRGMTTGFDDDEPWRLIVDDPERPAFMQCPSPGLEDYRSAETTPDDLDILYTGRNHQPKRTVAVRYEPDDWIFALVSLQTTAGFQGAGRYGIARMHGGCSARMCIGFAPARGGVGAHLVHDMRAMIERRDSLAARYAFEPEAGLALLWLHRWNGKDALDLRSLDPYFIEICRRIRLRQYGGDIRARTAGSAGRRIDAAALRGVVGDFWSPINAKDPKAFSLTANGFRYDVVCTLLLDHAWRLPEAMIVDPGACERWRLVARGVSGGQGKTAGYHELTDVTFADDIVKALLGGSGRGELGAIARAIGEETRQVLSALRFGIAVGAGGGREPEELTERQRLKAASCVRRLHHVIDTQFFDVLEARYRARGDERTAATVRNEYLQRLIAAARRLLDEVTTATAGSALYRRRAAAKSVDVFRQRLPRRANVLAGDPDVAGRGTAPRDEDDAGDEGVVVVDGVRLDVRGLSRELASLERRQVTALSRGPLAR